MPSILILDSRVWRGRPSFTAAPFEPPTRPAHSANARSINSRSLMLTAALKEMGGSARDAARAGTSFRPRRGRVFHKESRLAR
jgi:hypothetical protein